MGKMNEKYQNKRQTGSEYERRAACYLEEQGYRIIEMNYRCRYGEIDIIAKDGNYLVFAEVKYRAGTGVGLPQEAVNMRKQRIISKVAMYYCMVRHLPQTQACRFDVVAILDEDITLIQNAFPFQY